MSKLARATLCCWLVAGVAGCVDAGSDDFGTSTGNPTEQTPEQTPDQAPDQTPHQPTGERPGPTPGNAQTSADLGGPTGRGCEEQVEVLLDPSMATQLGFSPQDLLDLAEGSFTETLWWYEGRGTAQAGSEGEIEVTLRYRAGELRFVDQRPAPQMIEPGAPDIAVPRFVPNCPDRLEVDVEMTLRTSGGALQETIGVTLFATTPRVANVRTRIAMDALQGDLTWQVEDPETVIERTLGVFVQISGVGMRGGLDGRVERAPSERVAAEGNASAGAEGAATQSPSGGFALARFPAGDPCPIAFGPREGFVVAPDVLVGQISGESVTGVLAEAEVAVAWPDSGQSPLTLSLAPSHGCARLEAQPPTLDRHGRLTVTSADDRLHADFEATVEAAMSPAGQLQGLRLYNTTSLSEASLPAATIAAFVEGLDLGGYADGAFLFSLETTLGMGWALAEGQLEVLGQRPCMRTPPPTMPAPSPNMGTQSSAGCGIDHVSLLKAPLGSFEDEGAACEVYVGCRPNTPGLDQSSCVANIGATCAACLMPVLGSTDPCQAIEPQCGKECPWLAAPPQTAAACEELLASNDELDDEGRCMCSGCLESLGACVTNRGCGEILRCAIRTGCSNGPAARCAMDCKAEIDAWGGQSAWLANELGQCAARQACN